MKLRCGIDRARRGLSVTIIGFVGTNSGTNRHGFYWVLASNLQFSSRREGLWRKMRSTIHRARRDLSSTIISFTGTDIEANPFQKYSNPDLRYLTSTCPVKFFVTLPYPGRAGYLYPVGLY
jgi:hypothetical protein